MPTLGKVSARRFFFTHALDRPDLARRLVRLAYPRTLPVVLSHAEVARLLAATTCLKHQAALAVAYGAGLRGAEVAALKVTDIDSQRMLTGLRRSSVNGPSASGPWPPMSGRTWPGRWIDGPARTAARGRSHSGSRHCHRTAKLTARSCAGTSSPGQPLGGHMRALFTGAALLILAAAGASAQPLEDQRPPPGRNLNRPAPQEPLEAAPDDDDDEMGAPLRRRGPPSPDDDDDADAPPLPKSDRL